VRHGILSVQPLYRMHLARQSIEMGHADMPSRPTAEENQAVLIEAKREGHQIYLQLKERQKMQNCVYGSESLENDLRLDSARKALLNDMDVATFDERSKGSQELRRVRQGALDEAAGMRVDARILQREEEERKIRQGTVLGPLSNTSMEDLNAQEKDSRQRIVQERQMLSQAKATRLKEQQGATTEEPGEYDTKSWTLAPGSIAAQRQETVTQRKQSSMAEIRARGAAIKAARDARTATWEPVQNAYYVS